MNAKGFFGHITLGIDINMEILLGWQMVDQFNTADFHDPVASHDVEAGRFGIEYYFPKRHSNSLSNQIIKWAIMDGQAYAKRLLISARMKST